MVGLGMTLADTRIANDAKAVGEVFRITRERASLSIEAMAKKTGLRSAQLQALEDGDLTVFKLNSQEMLWAARLYARKLGLDIPTELRYAASVHKQTMNRFALPAAIPAFLIKTP